MRKLLINSHSHIAAIRWPLFCTVNGMHWSLARKERSSVVNFHFKTNVRDAAVETRPLLCIGAETTQDIFRCSSLLQRKILLTSKEGSVWRKKCTKRGPFLSWKTDRLPDLRVLPGHWSQRFCRELSRPIYNWSSK